jgi:hypothetical protein
MWGAGRPLPAEYGAHVMGAPYWSMACLATVRFAGPVLAPGGLRTAEPSLPVAPPALEYCLALADAIPASPSRPKSSCDIA